MYAAHVCSLPHDHGLQTEYMVIIMKASMIEAADIVMYALRALRYSFANSVMTLPATTN